MVTRGWAAAVLATVRANYHPRSVVSYELPLGYDDSQDDAFIDEIVSAGDDRERVYAAVRRAITATAIYPEHLPLYH